MALAKAVSEVYHDPYDVGIERDPYPVYRRLREESPLYYNEEYDFYALSRYEDVERGLVDSTTYSSSRGGILELIKADIEIPPATLIFEDPPRIPNAVEELLRFEPPAHHTGRYITCDVELYGQHVPRGNVMMFLNGSTNRDDRRFPDGDNFDIRRPIGSHLGFGYGIHYCLGAALARLEGRVALEEGAEAIPGLGCRLRQHQDGFHGDCPGLGSPSYIRRIGA